MINTLFHPVTLGHSCKQSEFKLEDCQALAWWQLFSCTGMCHPVNGMVCFFILPACPLSDVLNKLPMVAGFLISSGNMRCNAVSINLKGSNVPGGQVIPLVQSIKADLAFMWSSYQLVTIGRPSLENWPPRGLYQLITKQEKTKQKKTKQKKTK